MKRLILGPPGTGKTTYLLNFIERALEEGVSSEKIGYISFTRKAIDEARERAMKKFNVHEEKLPYFRTMHSLAFRMLSLSTSEVMSRKNYRDFGDELGIKITGQSQPDQMSYEMEKGDQMVFLESLARVKMTDIKNIYDRFAPDFSLEEFIHFKQSLLSYKVGNNLIDFTDMLTKYWAEGHKPELDVLFIDEAQDLNTLQWNICEDLWEKAKITYVAGDDDQSIFSWSGADIKAFLNLSTKFETTVLDKSYRLPRKIKRLAKSISDQIDSRNQKVFKSRETQGAVHRLSYYEDAPFESGEWLVLVRNGYLGRPLESFFRTCGYSFEGIYDKPLKSEGLEASFLWTRFANGQTVTGKQLKLVKPYISDKRILSFLPGEIVESKEYRLSSGSLPIWSTALGKLSQEEKAYFIASRKANENLRVPRITISTIHGAKGGECDNVLLLTDISARTYANLQRDPDSEHRVFYVGVTRAKENLYIVSPSGVNYYDI